MIESIMNRSQLIFFFSKIFLYTPYSVDVTLHLSKHPKHGNLIEIRDHVYQSG